MKRELAISLCVIVLTGACVAPTLTWQEFSNSSENLLVGTAQEIRRGGSWLAPTLQGVLRWEKPPAATWIVAASIRQETLSALNSRNLSTRAAGYSELAFEIRLTVLLASCVMLLGIYFLADMLGGARIALYSVAVAASSFFFLRFCRLATTDIFLALWVTWANVLVARAILRGTTWANCIGAGVLIGIAIMTKGPVALAQTIAPAALYVGWRSFYSRRNHAPAAPRLRIAPILAGFVAMLMVGAPWWLYVVFRLPNAVMKLQAQITGLGVPEVPDHWYSYFFVIGYLLPFTVFFVVALIQFAFRIARRESGPETLAAVMCVAPIVIMAFFRERHDRYLLPMLGPGAVMIAFTLQEHFSHWPNWNRGDRWLITAHWITIAILITLFLNGASTGVPAWMTRLDDGRPWYSKPFAMSMLALGLALVVAGGWGSFRWRGAIVFFSVLIALLAQLVVMLGFPLSETGRSDMRPLANAVLDHYPDAVAYNAHPRGKRPPSDLGVYLNREVIWTPMTSDFTPGGRPIVLFMLQQRGEPFPQAPPGFVWLAASPKARDDWHAFVMPAN